MALYSINGNLPGAKKVFTSEQVGVPGSSNFVPMFVVPLDPSNMQETFTDGYVALTSNTDSSKTTIRFNAPQDLTANQLAGQYAWVSFPTPEARLIQSNTSADTGNACTITVTKPYSTAPDVGHSLTVRRWEDFNLPSFHGTALEFAEKYIAKDSAGNFQWTNQTAAWYTLNEYKNNGGSFFYVLPVIYSTDADVLASRLAPTTDSVFTTRMAMINNVDLICVPKQPSLTADLSGTQWATVDSAWTTYIVNRATDDSVDDDLREMFYVADSHTAVTATSESYRTSDWNPTSERAGLWHGHYNVNDVVNKGRLTQVSLGPAVCGVINRISTGAPQSYGHAFEARNFAQVANLGLVEDLTISNRLSLIRNGINPLISKPGQGSWIESQTTMAKSSADTGGDPIEHLHVVLGRGKIWNSLQPILTSVVGEPNNPTTRQALLARVDSVMSTLLIQGIIAAYTLADVTSDNDVVSGTGRVELRVVFNREIDFVELKLEAALGQGG